MAFYIKWIENEYEWFTTKEATLFAAKSPKSVTIGLALSVFCIAGATALVIKK